MIPGHFPTFETPVPTSTVEWEGRKAAQRETLADLSGDLPEGRAAAGSAILYRHYRGEKYHVTGWGMCFRRRWGIDRLSGWVGF